MKYDTYLFDFDGTLVDSMPTYVSIMTRILDEYGISYGDDLIKIITPLGYVGGAKYYVEELGVSAPEEFIVEKMRAYAYEEYAHRIKAKNNVIEALKKLKSLGADLYILTASPHVTLDVCLERLGIYEMFTRVWSCEDFNTTKSDPELYRTVAGLIGKPIDEILFLDDNYNADRVAKGAGMPVCGVYDESSDEYVEEMKDLCDHYIFDFSYLTDI